MNSAGRWQRHWVAWLLPPAVYAASYAWIWMGAWIPIFISVHYGVALVGANLVGIGAALWGFRRARSPHLRVALLVCATAFTLVLSIALVEHFAPSGETDPWKENFAWGLLRDDDGEGYFIVGFIALTILLALYPARHDERAPSALARWLPTRWVRGFVHAPWMFVMMAGAVAVMESAANLCDLVSARALWSETFAKSEEKLDEVRWLDRDAFARQLLDDTYLFKTRLPASWDASRATAEEIMGQVRRVGDSYSWADDATEALAVHPTSGIIPGPLVDRFVTVEYVRKGYPADKGGIRRGDVIASCQFADNAKFFRECSPAEQTKLLIVRKRREGGVERIVLARVRKQPNYVLESKVIKAGGRRIGYLALESFLQPADKNFMVAADQLRREGIDDLVLDLRLNGGGDTRVMGAVATGLLGRKVAGRPMAYVRHAPRYARRDGIRGFPGIMWAGLGLKRLVVIQSPMSASASEILVVLLRDRIPVTLVGGKSVGKGVGCHVHIRNAHAFCFIDMELTSPSGKSVPEAGLLPDIAVKDDFKLPLGDPEEPLLKAAIEHCWLVKQSD